MTGRRTWIPAALLIAAYAGGQEVVLVRGVSKAGAFDVVTDPLSYQNLTVRIIELDPKQQDRTEYLSLEQGLSTGKVRIREQAQASVNTLVVRNQSSKPLLIVAGDVVRGGQQDRAIQASLVIPAGAESAVPVFCVEHGRWSGSSDFRSNTQVLCSKALKLAGSHTKDQSEVWQEVAKMNEMLAKKFGGLADGGSGTLNAALNTAKVRQVLQKFADAFRKTIETYPNSVGIGYEINGVPNSFDIFPNSVTFRQMWPKIVQSAALEAAAKSDLPQRGSAGCKTFVQMIREIRSLLEKGKSETIGGNQIVSASVADRAYLGTKAGGIWVHLRGIAMPFGKDE